MIQICVRETPHMWPKNRLDLAETAKHLAQRKSELREFDFVPLLRAARYLFGKLNAAL